MAVLGSGGRLELRRGHRGVRHPSGGHQSGQQLDQYRCDGYWPGDKVVISGPDGLPIFINGQPQLFDGVAAYGDPASKWQVAGNRFHINNPDRAGADDQFYKQDLQNDRLEYYPFIDFGTATGTYEDNAWFYYRGHANQDGTVEENPTTDLEGYLCIDSLGRAKLYKDRCSGLNCCGDNLLDFRLVARCSTSSLSTRRSIRVSELLLSALPRLVSTSSTTSPTTQHRIRTALLIRSALTHPNI